MAIFLAPMISMMASQIALSNTILRNGVRRKNAPVVRERISRDGTVIPDCDDPDRIRWVTGASGPNIAVVRAEADRMARGEFATRDELPDVDDMRTDDALVPDCDDPDRPVRKPWFDRFGFVDLPPK